MRLTIVSLRGVEFSGEAKLLNLKTSSGEITVLPGHRPLVTVLAPGSARIVRPGGETQTLALRGGFLEVDAAHDVAVLAD